MEFSKILASTDGTDPPEGKDKTFQTVTEAFIERPVTFCILSGTDRFCEGVRSAPVGSECACGFGVRRETGKEQRVRSERATPFQRCYTAQRAGSGLQKERLHAWYETLPPRLTGQDADDIELRCLLAEDDSPADLRIPGEAAHRSGMYAANASLKGSPRQKPPVSTKAPALDRRRQGARTKGRRHGAYTDREGPQHRPGVGLSSAGGDLVGTRGYLARYVGAAQRASMKDRRPYLQPECGLDDRLPAMLGDKGVYLSSKWFGRPCTFSLGHVGHTAEVRLIASEQVSKVIDEVVHPVLDPDIHQSGRETAEPHSTVYCGTFAIGPRARCFSGWEPAASGGPIFRCTTLGPTGARQARPFGTPSSRRRT
jgi:hypothetical protein